MKSQTILTGSERRRQRAALVFGVVIALLMAIFSLGGANPGGTAHAEDISKTPTPTLNKWESVVASNVSLCGIDNCNTTQTGSCTFPSSVRGMWVFIQVQVTTQEQPFSFVYDSMNFSISPVEGTLRRWTNLTPGTTTYAYNLSTSYA